LRGNEAIAAICFPSLSNFRRHLCVALTAVFSLLAAALKLLLFFDKKALVRVGAREVITRS